MRGSYLLTAVPMQTEVTTMDLLTVLNAFSAKMDGQFKLIDKRFESMDKRFDAMDERFDAMDKRFDALEYRVTHVETSVSRLEIDMKTVKAALVPAARMNMLQK